MDSQDITYTHTLRQRGPLLHLRPEHRMATSRAIPLLPRHDDRHGVHPRELLRD